MRSPNETFVIDLKIVSKLSEFEVSHRTVFPYNMFRLLSRLICRIFFTRASIHLIWKFRLVFLSLRKATDEVTSWELIILCCNSCVYFCIIIVLCNVLSRVDFFVKILVLYVAFSLSFI